MDDNQKRIHNFMEKFMNLRLLMKRTHKKDNNTRFVLVILHSIDEGKPVMISQISQKMEISNAASTQIVDNLEKQGWVHRIQDENDRRVIWVDLTEKGNKILKQTFKETSKMMEGLIQFIGEEDFDHLNRILDKVLDFSHENSFLKK